MMTPLLYKTLSDALGEMNTLGVLAQSNLDNMLNIISDTDPIAGKSADLAMLTQIVEDMDGFIQRNHVALSPTVKTMVITLQHFILLTYGSVDEFLEMTGVFVSSDFATLSSQCGFPISVENVET